MVWTREIWDVVSKGPCKLVIQTTYHLLGDHDGGLNREAAIAMIEEVLQARTQEIDDEDVVKAFLAEVVDLWDPSYCV